MDYGSAEKVVGDEKLREGVVSSCNHERARMDAVRVGGGGGLTFCRDAWEVQHQVAWRSRDQRDT